MAAALPCLFCSKPIFRCTLEQRVRAVLLSLSPKTGQVLKVEKSHAAMAREILRSLQPHSSAQQSFRRMAASVYGANPGLVERVLLVEANDRLRIMTGAGGSGATVSAVPDSLRFASTAERSGKLRLEDLPPYSRKVSVQTKWTG